MGQGHTAVHADRQSRSKAFRGNSARDLTLVLRIRAPMNSLDLRLSVQVHCPKDSLFTIHTCLRDLDFAIVLKGQKRVSQGTLRLTS